MSRADNKALIPNTTISITGPLAQSVTSATGAHTFEQIPAGTYAIKVSFERAPGYEKAVVVGVHPRGSTLGPGDLEIVEIEVGRAEPIMIELLDPDGNGVPNEPFELLTPDGRLVTGKLNRRGRTQVDQILPCGDCKIRFPQRDAEFLSFVSTNPF